MVEKYITNLMISTNLEHGYDRKEVEMMKKIIKKAQSDEGAELSYNTELHISIEDNSFYAYVCEKGDREMVYVVYSGCKNKDSKETLVNRTIKKVRENHACFKHIYPTDQYENAPYVVEIMNSDTYYKKRELIPWLMDFYNLFCWTIMEEGVA